jgi:hypothetical protein
LEADDFSLIDPRADVPVGHSADTSRLDAVERSAIARALAESHGNISRAAAVLGLTRSSSLPNATLWPIAVADNGPGIAPEQREKIFVPFFTTKRQGSGVGLIRRGKADAEGQGRVAYLSRETVRWLTIWLEHAKISEGPIFRRLIGAEQIGEALHPGSIAPIFKRVAQWIGMPERFVAEVSGHSTRVGAAQDLAELDIDLAAITQAGGWKSTRMPLQYAEKINAARSGMARAAAAAGRDEEVSD